MTTSSSSSVVSGIPLPQKRWDSSCSRGRRSIRVNIPVPAASLPSTRFHLSRSPTAVAARWQGDVRNGNTIGLAFQNKNNNNTTIRKKKKKKKSDAPKAWKWHSPVSHLQQFKKWIPCCSSLSRNCYRKTTLYPLATFFLDKSCFPLSTHTLNTASGNQIYAPCATVGPDEPHAASTTWPDGLLEKQDFDSLYPQLQTAE